MEQLSQNISSTCRGDNVDTKYTNTTTIIIKLKTQELFRALEEIMSKIFEVIIENNLYININKLF